MDKQLFVTTIPHFAEANLNSFCWFLESGLSDELRNFSSALNLNKKLNIKIYSDEFILKRPKPLISVAWFSLTPSVIVSKIIPKIFSNSGFFNLPWILCDNFEIISLLKINIPVYDADNLPDDLKKIKPIKPGSRIIQ